MSKSRSERWGRKKRYAIASVVAIIGISVAAYLLAENHFYKNTREWNFDSYKDGAIPEGFSYFQNDLQHDFWIVKSDSSAPSMPNVLVKLTNNETTVDYNLQVMPDGIQSANYEASVRIKIDSEEKSQAAGLIFRLVDTRQYFVLVADSANKTFSLCRADPGKLLCLIDKRADVTPDKWHTITASISAEGIAGYLDNKLLIQRYDQHYQNGQIGLWTKKDTQAYFDDLTMKY